ncbi:MAG TPA: HD domain-containing phosphohydrolase [Lysobacter sp.]|nr:HD domain-containing phosphohydrolase [Lysobacter sp.]
MDIGAREVRISVQGLGLGMYVSRLDRPWLETAFLLHGLKITSDDEIAMLQRICNHVWVDVTLGKTPDPRHIAFAEPEAANRARASAEVQDLRKTDWGIQVDVQKEMQKAEEVHASLEASIGEVMTDLQAGKRLDLDKLKDGVDAMVDSILRNPTAFVWLKEMKRRDDYAYQHAMGCSIWAASFGRHLGLERAELQLLALGGLLCDVGKTRLSTELLSKRTPLTGAEVALVHQHVQHGLDIIDSTPNLSPRIREIVATHHERHDGSGYPWRLAGSEIPIFGRIMGVVDSYEAMTSTRPYAKSRSPHQAVNELYLLRGKLFQAELIEQFIQNCGIYPTGSLVELSNGQVAVVTDVHSLKRLRPRVMLLLDADKLPLQQFKVLDLGEVEEDERGQPLTVKNGLPTGAYGIDAVELFLG